MFVSWFQNKGRLLVVKAVLAPVTPYVAPAKKEAASVCNAGAIEKRNTKTIVTLFSLLMIVHNILGDPREDPRGYPVPGPRRGRASRPRTGI